ncbi:MAG: HPr family phosphocarrier protein [Pseudomonadota bacterium]|nr:HPr family phosphocarrier protein [Pseudomonadota bacterium]
MLHTKVLICNKLGLHARAAIKLVTLASRFAAETQLTRDGKTVNCKSIMGVMMLGASKGTELDLTATGDDEQKALEQIKQLIDNRFDEAE